MRRLGRVEHVVKWTASLLCAVTMVGFCASFVWTIEYYVAGFRFNLGIGPGVVHIALRKTSLPPPSALPWYDADVFWTQDTDWEWYLLPERGGNRTWDYISIPMWILFVITALPTTVLWFRDRRRYTPGYCQRCGYNLTGNVSGRCPECGAAT